MRFSKYLLFTSTLTIFTLIGSINQASACSSCGCSFNSDWASEGYSNNSGWRFDTRFDYINQNNLRYGSGSVSKGSLELPNDNEIQQHTITRETLFGLDYSPDRYWGLHLALPYLDRTHSSIGEGDTDVSHSGTNGLGDTSIVARYQGFTPLANLGVQFGLKFPTGKFTDTFNSGPMQGMAIDRGLQNGTGTTDAILGVYYFGSFTPELDYFAQIQGDQPFEARDGFRPSTSVVTSTGVGYKLNSWIKPQLQVNYKYESRESGENADRPNSGGNIIALTPGINFAASQKLNVYALVQIPVFQEVNGYQLEPRQVYSVGIRYDL